MSTRTPVVAWNKLRAVLSRSRRDREMDEEMRFHIDREAVELRRAGVPADEALRRARAAFGGIERHKDDARDTVGIRLLHDLASDARYAARQLRASPGFTAATLVTLALGIGATTVMYTLEHVLRGDPLPVAQPEQLVHVGQGAAGNCLACSRIATGNYMTIRDESRTLADVSLIVDWQPILRGAERTEVIDGARVTPAFFAALKTPAMLGRTIVPADSAPDRQNVVVISESFWRTRLGADSGVVGSTIVLDAAPHTIVGVVATPYAFPRGTFLWAPRVLGATEAADRSWTDDNAIARMRPGTTLEQVNAELATIGARVASSYPATMHNSSFGAQSLAAWETPGGADDVPLLLAVGLVLAIASVNLAGLLLARLTARRRELAVRAAMGASGRRIARQLVTETVLLAVVGGAAGAGVAAAGVRVLRDALPAFVIEDLPNWMAMHVDLRALLIALATGAFTGIAISLWPALRFSRIAPGDELRDGARSATAGGGVSGVRRGLVVAEVAFAIVLLAAAGLLARSLRKMYAVDPGVHIDHVLTFRVNAPRHARGDSTPVDWMRFERLAEALRAMPGVERAAAVYGLPYGHGASTNGFQVQGRVYQAPVHRRSVQMVPTGTDYFATLGIPIVRGRAFASTDNSSAPRVAIIDATVANRDFANEDPIGRSVIIDSVAWQIVGIAAPTRHDTRGRVVAGSAGEIYRPMAQWHWPNFAEFALRTRDDPLLLAPHVVPAVRDFDPDLAVTRVLTMDKLVDDDIAPDRVLAGMLGAFAVAALLIASIGLYGVISYGVAQRMREFGIRRALGAETAALLALVLGQGARLAVLGATIGLVAAVAVTQLMRSILFEMSPVDPVTLVSVALTMCIVGVAAAYPPARRATRVDPMVSLREE